MKRPISNSGFTLVELLAVIAISGLLCAYFLSSFSSLRSQRQLDASAHRALSILDRARSQTLASQGGLQYGVYFSSTTATLFSGASYSAGASGNQAAAIDPLIRISGISLAGGGSSAVFDRLSGKTAQSGTITLSIAADPSKTRVITVYATGVSELNAQ